MEAFGSFRKFLRFFGFLSRFSTFPDVIFTKDFFHGTIRAWQYPLQLQGQGLAAVLLAVSLVVSPLGCPIASLSSYLGVCLVGLDEYMAA